ncbi:general substrate transporter [Crucibulum laeve]|uniref:General substrate transporter n=1 Tax=Crucibulum laeve TaxID=68775 RepID=A0A5C3LYQ8_9AGAR|nr:general substrate transporter [Crucibulum laeve]
MAMGINAGYLHVSLSFSVPSFGYDAAVGAVVTLPAFRRDFHITPSSMASISSNIVSLLFGGAWFGSIIFAWLSRRIGRRYSLMGGIFIFLIGGIIQTACDGHLGQFYAGRFIAGLGVGAVSQISPTFVAECAPREQRGRAVAMLEMNLARGFLSYWITYAMSMHVSNASSSQWRIPIAMQIVLGGIAFLFTIPIKESPRWLIRTGKETEGLISLAYLRAAPTGNKEVLQEFAEIKAQLRDEDEAAKGFSPRELLLPYNLRRIIIAIFMGFWASWTAHTALMFYAPIIFQQIGFSATTTSLLASGVFVTMKVVLTVIAIAYTVHRYGRISALVVGATITGIIFFILAAIMATHPPELDGRLSAASKAMMALIYLHVIVYSLTMGPLPWVYVSEIFPLRIRELGQMSYSISVWTATFSLTKASPLMFRSIGWKTWIIFATINVGGSVVCWLLCPETKGLSLEEIDILFGSVSNAKRAANIEHILQAEGADKVTRSLSSTSSEDGSGKDSEKLSIV